tara:strand:+ start:1223 stop:2158 length:936 start_codon:yes stop_codon:yes gene_type:complete
MNILVTGGAGYIGSVLVQILLKNNFNVTVLDNFLFKQKSLNQIKKNRQLNIVEGDVRDESIIKDLVTKSDIIIPLAALVGAPLCDIKPKEAKEVNLNSMFLLKSILSKNQRVILPVSNSGYGIGKSGEFCTEESPLNPISLYGQTKVQSESIIMERENSISFRLATVFGMSPRMRIDLLVNYFVNKALTEKKIQIFEGHFKRNYVHIKDVANVFLFTIKNFEKMKSNTYNFGLEDANFSKIELAEKIKKYINNFEIQISEFGKDPDKRDYIVSNKKILSTGYKFLEDLDSGIQELIREIPNLSKNESYSNV